MIWLSEIAVSCSNCLSLILPYVCENRDFWRRHRRKIFVTVGALGGGYVLYKLYDANRRRVIEWERELAEQERILAERENFIKAQLRDILISCFISTKSRVLCFRSMYGCGSNILHVSILIECKPILPIFKGLLIRQRCPMQCII